MGTSTINLGVGILTELLIGNYIKYKIVTMHRGDLPLQIVMGQSIYEILIPLGFQTTACYSFML